jgi:cellulose synthase/poly-beta-1,6-N-acetylglucosamine synthase-like glycosyltransferase
LSGDQIIPGNLPTVSVIIPAYSLDRWESLREAVASVQAQTVKVLETVVSVDHNPELLAKVSREFPEITVVTNTGKRGASGNRNTGVAASRGKVLAFLDDDAVADPNWLEVLLRPLADPSVVGVGGRLEPMWQTSRPRWFPFEFDWTVGCSYLGMPKSTATVRNVWSNNMAIRRDVFDAIGGFRDGFGKIDSHNHPEDTDLCLRAAVYNGGGVWIYEPKAVARHQVPADRATLAYFFKRCYNEGQGKAALASLNGVTASTSIERRYARRVLPRGFIRGLLEMIRGEASGAARSLAIAAGMSLAMAGFIVNRTIARVGIRRERSVSSQ